MKNVLYLALTVFALFLTACYSSGINTPGITARGLSASLPSPAYGHMANESKSLDYQHVEVMESMNYELKMNNAWELCINKHGQDVCREIHGTPYYMSNFYSPMYGSSMQGMGYGMGYHGSYMGMQMQSSMKKAMMANQIAAYTNMYNSYADAYTNYAQAESTVLSTPANDPSYNQKMAQLKAMYDKLKAIHKEVVDLIKEARPAIQQAAEQAGE
ncbi:hypothetical protein KJ969_05055 [Patescibacteria group bacterium]|nr:hypothetical protein [Patescibacteria group bacterium]MBU1921903.1 hypothetical protein [Patescibacteria group bacterium]